MHETRFKDWVVNELRDKNKKAAAEEERKRIALRDKEESKGGLQESSDDDQYDPLADSDNSSDRS